MAGWSDWIEYGTGVLSWAAVQAAEDQIRQQHLGRLRSQDPQFSPVYTATAGGWLLFYRYWQS